MNWREQATELWGVGWRRSLAAITKRTLRTVNNWCSGRHKVPKKILRKIDETHTLWARDWVEWEGGKQPVPDELVEALQNICGRGGYMPTTDYKKEVSLMQSIARDVLNKATKEG